jgi:hypothetical protein
MTDKEKDDSGVRAQAAASSPVSSPEDLVLCSLREPDMVCHLPRLDCQHESPHLIAACGAFPPRRTDAEIAAAPGPVASPVSQPADHVRVEDVLAILTRWRDAYPVEVFGELSPPSQPASRDCIAGAQGRHMADALAAEVRELAADYAAASPGPGLPARCRR